MRYLDGYDHLNTKALPVVSTSSTTSIAIGEWFKRNHLKSSSISDITDAAFFLVSFEIVISPQLVRCTLACE